MSRGEKLESKERKNITQRIIYNFSQAFKFNFKLLPIYVEKQNYDQIYF